MNDSTVFVGLDYHQDSVPVCMMDRPGRVLGNRACENVASTTGTVVENHGTVVPMAIESCSGVADLADKLVQRPGWSGETAHPGFVARMKQNPDKTDFTDARLLADLERVRYLPGSGRRPVSSAPSAGDTSALALYTGRHTSPDRPLGPVSAAHRHAGDSPISPPRRA